MPGMKKDGLSCWACASNRYEEFHAQHEKKKKKRTERNAGHVSQLFITISCVE